MLKKILKSKQDGGVEVVIATLIAVLVLVFIFVYFASNMLPINNKYKAESIVRKYVLKSEQDGYLTANNVSSMELELKNIGISNVDISGTTLNPVSYGDDVSIDISYKDNIKTLSVKNGIIPTLSNVEKTVTINKSSTSKKVVN